MFGFNSYHRQSTFLKKICFSTFFFFNAWSKISDLISNWNSKEKLPVRQILRNFKVLSIKFLWDFEELGKKGQIFYFLSSNEMTNLAYFKVSYG